MVISDSMALRQDIRPMHIAILNLMPLKIQTEIQFSRLIGATPLQIEMTLIRMSNHKSKNASAEHMSQFYRPFKEVKENDEKFDGLIITGAPIEHLPFEQVTYWDELCEIMDWTQTNVFSTFGVCWGGMAMMYHFHGIEKRVLDKKLFGCYPHRNNMPSSPYLRGFSDECVIPVSRWTEMDQKEIDATGKLNTLLCSDEAGPCLIEDPCHRALYIFNHFEYDNNTLQQEYERDVANGTPINVPMNYYPNDDPTQAPRNRWRSHGHLLYGNWINEMYQHSPFDLNEIGNLTTDDGDSR